MTRTTNARLAGFTFLFYIAVAFPQMVLMNRATTGEGEGIAGGLASVAAHANDVRISVVLGVCACFAALVLAVTLYAITRDEDRDLALIGLVCRVGEGIISGVAMLATLGTLWLATTTGPDAPVPAAAQALGAYLLKVEAWSPLVSATFFAAGSTFFSWLMLRGRIIPVVLAWVGVVASILLVICLPLELAGFLQGPITQLMWLPMAAFEIPLGFWLLVKGVRVNERGQKSERLESRAPEPLAF